jgi:hypothetical protein
MTSESDWDVEKYKNDYESEDHWELKKTFIEGKKKTHGI